MEPLTFKDVARMLPRDYEGFRIRRASPEDICRCKYRKNAFNRKPFTEEVATCQYLGSMTGWDGVSVLRSKCQLCQDTGGPENLENNYPLKGSVLAWCFFRCVNDDPEVVPEHEDIKLAVRNYQEWAGNQMAARFLLAVVAKKHLSSFEAEELAEELGLFED